MKGGSTKSILPDPKAMIIVTPIGYRKNLFLLPDTTPNSIAPKHRAEKLTEFRDGISEVELLIGETFPKFGSVEQYRS